MSDDGSAAQHQEMQTSPQLQGADRRVRVALDGPPDIFFERDPAALVTRPSRAPRVLAGRGGR